MIWSKILNLQKKCNHSKVPLDVEYYYCPDCGKLIKNHWYIVRCACCKTKEVAAVIDGEVIAKDEFCHNCGSNEYIIEEIDKINCININYAVVLKKEVEFEETNITQSWIENAMQITNCKQKLLQ